jgi:hypothetical protein
MVRKCKFCKFLVGADEMLRKQQRGIQLPSQASGVGSLRWMRIRFN